MGLAPSRQLYQDGGVKTVLPFISRPAEDYHYNNGEPPNAQQLAAATAAAALAAASNKGNVKLGAAARAAAMRGSNRGGASPGDSMSDAGGAETPRPGGSINSTPAAAGANSVNSAVYNAAGALPISEDGLFYYYEHRLVPLTKEFFPSPDCVLFEQLWNARQLQNPRYHFQLEHTWSPGSLLDPAASFDTFESMAAQSMLEDAMFFATKVGMEELNGASGDGKASAKQYAEEQKACGVEMSNMELRDIPFSSREELFDLLIRTTENDIMYESNQALCSAATHIIELTSKEEQQQHDQKAGGEKALGSSLQSERRIRPLPCAVVLVRTPVTAATYRNIYYVANGQRHHKMGTKALAKRRKQGFVEENGMNVINENEPPQEAREIQIFNAEVLEAVREHESHRLRQLPTSTATAEERDAAMSYEKKHSHTTLTPDGPRSAWMTVRRKGEPVGCDLGRGPIEMRVVGMYGCWTVQEILKRTLFSRILSTPATQTLTPVQLKQQQKAVDAVLQRATPYGVPSHTLVQVTFFERQVGDKEQSHTFFSLCRYFAHGMRYCLNTSPSASLSQSGSMHDSVRSGSAHWLRGATTALTGVPEERDEQLTPWEAFVRALEQPVTLEQGSASTQEQSTISPPPTDGNDSTMSGSAMRQPPSTVTNIPQAHSDLSSAIFIRFSNIPQLQLTRQIRILAQELRSSYPKPMRLVTLQSSQRARTNLPNPPNADNLGVGGNTESPHLGPESARGHTPERMEVQGIPAALCRRNVAPALDPDAIRTPPTATPTERLREEGIFCYIANGLVVVRISHQFTVRSLFQMSYSLLEETIEAICVTLSTSSPPQMAYRGELRPAVRGGLSNAFGVLHSPSAKTTSTTTPSAHTNTSSASATTPNAPSGVDQLNPKSPAFQAIMEDSYYNSVRFLMDASKGFPMLRYRCPFRTLEEIRAEEATGEHPEEGQQQREEKADNDSDKDNDDVGVFGTREGKRYTRYKIDHSVTLANMAPYDIAVQPRSRLDRERGNYLPLHPAVSQILDVYTVSAELDGKTMQHVFDLSTRKHYGVTFPSSLFIANTPDSVLGWSPGAQLKGSSHLYGMGAPTPTATSASGTPLKRMDSASSVGTNYPLARVQDPTRVLRAGDVIRFTPSASPTSTRTITPTSVRRPGGTGRDSRRNPRELCSGTWYVDDSINVEDLVLSWMRRVSGRARESKASDMKWLSYPPAVQNDLMKHAVSVVEKYSQCFIDDPVLMGGALRSAERQACAELVKAKGFRQWRFSQDGFVYFHGVTAGVANSQTLVELLAESMGKRVLAVSKAKIDVEREQGLAAIKAEASKTKFFDHNQHSNPQQQQQQQQQRLHQQPLYQQQPIRLPAPGQPIFAQPMPLQQPVYVNAVPQPMYYAQPGAAFLPVQSGVAVAQPQPFVSGVPSVRVGQAALVNTGGPAVPLPKSHAQQQQQQQQWQQQQQEGAQQQAKVPPPPGIQPYTGSASKWSMPAVGDPTSSGYPQEQSKPTPGVSLPQHLQQSQLQQQQQHAGLEGSINSQTTATNPNTPGFGGGGRSGGGAGMLHEDTDALAKPIDNFEGSSFLEATPSYGPAQLTEGFFDQGGSLSASHRAGAASDRTPSSRRGSLGYNATAPQHQHHHQHQQQHQLPIPIRISPTTAAGGGSSRSTNPSGSDPQQHQALSGRGGAPGQLRIVNPALGSSTGGGGSVSSSPTTTTKVGTIDGEGGLTVQIRTRTRRDSLQQQRLRASPAAPGSTTSPQLPSQHQSFSQIQMPDEDGYGAQYGAMGISPGGGEDTFLQPPQTPNQGNSNNYYYRSASAVAEDSAHAGGGGGSSYRHGYGYADALSNSGRQSSATPQQHQRVGSTIPAPPPPKLSHSGIHHSSSGRVVTTHNPYYLPERDAMSDSPSALSIRSRGQSFNNNNPSRSQQQIAQQPSDDGGFLASAADDANENNENNINNYYAAGGEAGGAAGAMYGSGGGNYYYSMAEESAPYQAPQQGAYPNVPPIARWSEHQYQQPIQQGSQRQPPRNDVPEYNDSSQSTGSSQPFRQASNANDDGDDNYYGQTVTARPSDGRRAVPQQYLQEEVAPPSSMEPLTAPEAGAYHVDPASQGMAYGGADEDDNGYGRRPSTARGPAGAGPAERTSPAVKGHYVKGFPHPSTSGASGRK